MTSPGSSAIRGLRASDLDPRRLRPANLSSGNPRAAGAPSELHALIASVPAVHECPHTRPRDAPWRAVLYRAQSSRGPGEARVLGRRGRTALHAACAVRPPLAVVKALLEACGEDGAAARDNHGRTALAVAVAGGASPAVCELLLRANPRSAAVSDHGGMLPLHLACGAYDHPTCDAQKRLVRSLLGSFPNATGRECHRGRTPLHVAIEGRAGLGLVQLLLKTCPEALVMDGCGSTPLMIAIQQHASPAMVRYLVKANPAAAAKLDGASGQYPVRHAILYHYPVNIIEALADAGGLLSLDHQDDRGRTALHLALDRSPYLGGRDAWCIARALLERAPQLASMADKAEISPLDLVCRHYCRASQDPIGGGLGGTEALAEESDMPRMTDEARHAWDAVLLLLRAYRYGTVGDLRSDDDAWRVLHAAFDADCPAKVIKTALALFPSEARERDCVGRLPLHLSLNHRPSPCGSQARSAIVEMLLDSHPEAAKVPNPADGHRLPLHAAVRCGWLEPGTLRKILHEHPDALRKLDPSTRLYPFQVAAINHISQSKRSGSKLSALFKDWGFEESWDLSQTNAIFELLLAGPDLLLPLQEIC